MALVFANERSRGMISPDCRHDIPSRRFRFEGMKPCKISGTLLTVPVSGHATIGKACGVGCRLKLVLDAELETRELAQLDLMKFLTS